MEVDRKHLEMITFQFAAWCYKRNMKTIADELCDFEDKSEISGGYYSKKYL